MQFLQFFKSKCSMWFGLPLRIISLLIFVCFNSILEINDLVFLSNLDLLLLNNFLKNENQEFIFWNVFSKLSTQFFNTKKFKFKIHSATFSTNGGQSRLKLQANVQIKLFFQLWMLISSNLYGQTSWNLYHMTLDK